MLKRNLIGIFTFIAMLLVILNAGTIAASVQAGIDLCLRCIIPSLFPFFILSGFINICYLGQSIAFLRPLRRLCKIPCGLESILLIGLLSGYPIGAQLITEGYLQGSITKNLIDPSNWTKTTSAPSFNQDTSDYDNNIELVKTLKVDGPDYNSFFESKFVKLKHKIVPLWCRIQSCHS